MPRRPRAATPTPAPPAPLSPPPQPPLRVAFLHPDLGLGGAERLVVDAAWGLASRGHAVTMFTSHYEPSRSFAETRSGAFPVVVHGDFLPRSLLGGLMVFFAMLRMCWLAVRVALHGRFDVLVVDQVSACVPLLKLLCPSSRVLFYCHYPDQLLAPRGSLLRAAYRAPFDAWEQVTTGLADGVLVNSRFTGGAFAAAFPWLHRGGVAPEVLYPCVPLGGGGGGGGGGCRGGARLLVSINRFERKKEVGTVIRAFAAAGKGGDAPPAGWHLVLAGGYDTRLSENVAHFEELCALARGAGLVGAGGLRDAGKAGCAAAAAWAARVPGWPPLPPPLPPYAQVLCGERVTLVRSFSDAQKGALLGAATAVAYTPPGEHFGIVPLECMAAGLPVLACASGGPLESVEHGETGFLCEDEKVRLPPPPPHTHPPPCPAAHPRLLLTPLPNAFAGVGGADFAAGGAAASPLERHGRRGEGARGRKVFTRGVCCVARVPLPEPAAGGRMAAARVAAARVVDCGGADSGAAGLRRVGWRRGRRARRHAAERIACPACCAVCGLAACSYVGCASA
jgi:alpha-1,3/alpha-1,6-mannosyltransferase